MSSGSGCTPSGGFASNAGPSPKLRTSGGGFIDGNGAPRNPFTSGGRSCADAADSETAIITNDKTVAAAWDAVRRLGCAEEARPDGGPPAVASDFSPIGTSRLANVNKDDNVST